MWLRNFYNMWAWMITGSKTSDNSFNDNALSIKNVKGVYNTYMCGYTDFYYCYPFASNSNDEFRLTSSGTMSNSQSGLEGIVFGGGDKEVTFDDYTLDSWLDFTFSISNDSQTAPVYDEDTRTWSSTLSFDFKNTSSTDVVLKEVGIMNYGKVLLYREVLAEPITLKAGQTMNYSHKFSYTMPIH